MVGDDLKENDLQAAATHLKSVPDAPPQELEFCSASITIRSFDSYRITGSPVDAEDVLQTVFLCLARREGKNRPATESGGIFIARFNQCLS